MAACCALALVLPACQPQSEDDGRVRAVIKGETFRLVPALNDADRLVGLAWTEFVPPDEADDQWTFDTPLDAEGEPEIKTLGTDAGLIFVFPRRIKLNFIMRNCVAPIDVAFLDDTGRVVTMHTMPVEPLRREGERPFAYEQRLTRYPSVFPVRIAVEVAGGTFERLGLEQGDRIEVDLEPLKAAAE
jgi:uncharacterized membrane protein (UPF0127 family)